jgi:hypothetical protein
MKIESKTPLEYNTSEPSSCPECGAISGYYDKWRPGWSACSWCFRLIGGEKTRTAKQRVVLNFMRKASLALAQHASDSMVLNLLFRANYNSTTWNRSWLWMGLTDKGSMLALARRLGWRRRIFGWLKCRKQAVKSTELALVTPTWSGWCRPEGVIMRTAHGLEWLGFQSPKCGGLQFFGAEHSPAVLHVVRDLGTLLRLESVAIGTIGLPVSIAAPLTEYNAKLLLNLVRPGLVLLSSDHPVAVKTELYAPGVPVRRSSLPIDIKNIDLLSTYAMLMGDPELFGPMEKGRETHNG